MENPVNMFTRCSSRNRENRESCGDNKVKRSRRVQKSFGKIKLNTCRCLLKACSELNHEEWSDSRCSLSSPMMMLGDPASHVRVTPALLVQRRRMSSHVRLGRCFPNVISVNNKENSFQRNTTKSKLCRWSCCEKSENWFRFLREKSSPIWISIKPERRSDGGSFHLGNVRFILERVLIKSTERGMRRAWQKAKTDKITDAQSNQFPLK